MTRVDGSCLSYADSGVGVPVLFVHGWLMSRRVWAMQASLAAGFRLISFDLRGHGDDAGAAFSYETCCADIALLIERLGLERVILVGWSMGAQIVLRAFSRLVDRVAGMVLVGGTPLFCRSSDFDCGIAPAEVRSMALRIKRAYQRTAGEFFSAMFSRQDIDTINMRSIAGSVVARLPSQDVALAALQELVNGDLREELQRITVPVLVIHGDADTICLADASRFMAARLSTAQLEIFPGVGHAPFLTHPEEFNRLLSGFVQGVHGRN